MMLAAVAAADVAAAFSAGSDHRSLADAAVPDADYTAAEWK